jgi:hypothetical protein
MSALLDDIIGLAIDGNQPLPDLLRKCLLLGHELKNERLKEWANQELTGYKTGRGLPEYRIIPAQARGSFIGPFHAQFPSHIIPPAVLEAGHRGWAERVYLLQAVSAFADILKDNSSTQKSLVFHWPPYMVAYYQDKIMPDFICHSAWQSIPPSALAELLDSVRNRTLNMALGIKEELGTSFADLSRIKSGEAATKIQSIVIQNTGGSTNVAFAHASLDASGQTVVAVRDKQALDAVLRKSGLEKVDLDNLTEAMEIDGTEPGSRVGEWIKSNASKVLTGGVKIGTKIGTEILTALIKQHYGLNQP